MKLPRNLYEQVSFELNQFHKQRMADRQRKIGGLSASYIKKSRDFKFYEEIPVDKYMH